MRSAEPDGMPPSGGRRPRNPWWIPPFLGRVPPVAEPHLRLLGAVALALLFEEYDLAMLTLSLKFIAAELGMAEAGLGYWLGLIRLGALPAVLLVPFIDRVGRRRVFLWSLVGTGAFTVLTAFSRDATWFVVFQLLTRTFFVAGSAAAFVMVAEEFPAEHRGWGLGMLAALGSAGHGLAALLFSQIEHLPYGWRALYAVGFVPLVMLPWFRRRLRETDRFTRHRESLAARGSPAPFWSDWLSPMRELLTRHPSRTLGMALASGLFAFGSIAAFQFSSYFALKVHHWSPGQFAAMFVVGGAMGIIGNVAAGRLADRFGRRRVGLAALASFPLFVGLFYLGPGWALPLGWIGFVFCSGAGRTILRAFATELFPTAQRGTATGWWSMIDATAAAGGLFALGFAATGEGTIRAVPPALALAVLVGGCVLMAFPETRRRELEEISG